MQISHTLSLLRYGTQFHLILEGIILFSILVSVEKHSFEERNWWVLSFGRCRILGDNGT